MTFPPTPGQHPNQDPISWMSDEQYVTCQRRSDDELIERFYSQGLIPPPWRRCRARLEPPFESRALRHAGNDPSRRDALVACRLGPQRLCGVSALFPWVCADAGADLNPVIAHARSDQAAA